MRFFIVRPREKTHAVEEFAELTDAIVAAGLDPTSVDHGHLRRDLAYVVHEFGLFIPPEEQSYFRIGPQLMAGAAVFYGVGAAGETVDVEGTEFLPVAYMTAEEAEEQMSLGLCRRPRIAVNDEVIWQWPDKPPTEFAEAMERKRRK